MATSESTEHVTLEACRAVDSRVRGDLDAELTSVKRTIVAKLALAFFVTGYMAWAINRIALIDADFVVTTVRDNLRGGAQSFVGEASGELKRQAPMMVKELHKNLIDGVPALRNDIEHSLLASVDPVAAEIEKSMSSDVGKMIEDYKGKVDAANAKLSDTEKLTRLVFMMRQDFRKEASKVINHSAEQFSADIKNINKQLLKLREGKNLTAAEKLQRDILATWNKLAKIKVAKGEVVPDTEAKPEEPAEKAEKSE